MQPQVIYTAEESATSNVTNHMMLSRTHLKNHKRKNSCNSYRKAFNLFCKCTSVRGMSKLHSGPRFLRVMWLLFVLSMTCLLISATGLLVKDFLNYDVSVYTQLRLDDPSPFPALTVCHQPPFSYNAYELWKRKEIISPSQYNRYMRQLTLDALYRNDLESVSRIWGYDSLSVYYQNLPYHDAVRLGHTSSIYLSCMRGFSHTFAFEDDCNFLPGYRVYQISHHLYLNCHTFEPINPEEANETTIFSLVVGMGPRDKDIELQQAFFLDVFEQARGLRIVVHEAGTLPDLEKNGLHVEPGKLNEITYEAHRWNKLDTPKRRCMKANETHRFRDLERWFNYTHADCLMQYQQLEIMRNCHCIYVMHPRLSLPSVKLPYCGRLLPNYNQTAFVERLECLAKYLDNDIKRKYDGTKCFPRCNYYDYSSTTSITKWRGYPWQLYWLRVQNQASQTLMQLHSEAPGRNLSQETAFKQWELYLTYENLTHIPTKSELLQLPGDHSLYDKLPQWPPEGLDLDSDDFAYVVLKRKSPNTVEQNEKLVLSLYVLVSRVGGLCSLTVGLTAAFVVELLEFIYLFYVQSKASKTGTTAEELKRTTTEFTEATFSPEH